MVLEGVTWFRQAAFRWRGDGGPVVYVDPWGVTDEVAADVILITHAHYDHFQPTEIERLRGPATKIVAPKDVAADLSGDVVPVSPGESHVVGPLPIQTVPAYNIVEERLDMHPQRKGWVGYLFEYGGHRYYHGGDTDALPELETISTDVAMVPIGGTYTMTAEEAAALVRTMRPGVAVPMHYGFVVCSPSRADIFRREAQPVPVEILTPTNPFEQP